MEASRNDLNAAPKNVGFSLKYPLVVCSIDSDGCKNVRRPDVILATCLRQLDVMLASR